MNKKKVISTCMVGALALTAAIGGTMAYFTDIDYKDNTFTTGKVDITLNEVFDQNSKLLPVTGSAQAGTLKNGVKKEVTVANNTGSEDSYVRVHIAIPAILDNGDSSFDAGKNVLHFNYDSDSIGAGKWDWSKTAGAPYEGDWNYYETTIDNIKYNVYVITYGTALKAGDETVEKAIHQVYLDKGVTSDDMAKINEQLGGKISIKVLAEGVQAEGFDNAYDALNAAFGVPGNYTPDWSKVK